MPTIYITALRIGGVGTGSMDWYWRMPQHERQAADARTKNHIDATYRTSLWSLSGDQAKAVYQWARALHA